MKTTDIEYRVMIYDWRRTGTKWRAYHILDTYKEALSAAKRLKEAEPNVIYRIDKITAMTETVIETLQTNQD